MTARFRSNIQYWKEMQENSYFERHPCYKGLVDMGDNECDIIEWFMPLRPDMRAVVIGCGYGRESARIARRVGHLYGIDVSETILAKARKYLGDLGVTNFTDVLAETYRSAIPDGIDLVFSIVVFQHLTRDLVRDYVGTLGKKLGRDGRMVIQFLEEMNSDLTADADLRTYEPSISWSIRQIVEMARALGLELEAARSYMPTPTAIWHWVSLRRAPAA